MTERPQIVDDSLFGRPELVRQIRGWIRRHGPMTFDRFMEIALYEPEVGYYASMPSRDNVRPGASADFQTSPQVHSAFGHLLARYLGRAWEQLGRPDPFVVVELGAGAGELAAQVADGLGERGEGLRVAYHAVDARYDGLAPSPSPSEMERKEEPLRRFAPRGSAITCWRSLDDVVRGGIRAHCVLSNEFFDALPVHRVARIGGRLREVYVDWSERGFVERVDEVSDPALVDWFEGSETVPPEGWRGEVCFRLKPMVAAIARVLDRGIVLSIDYGYESAEFFDPSRAGGTLVAYYRHHWNDDVLRRVGEQDLTSHVDFGALTRLGRQCGLEPVLLTTQREFLLELGLAADLDQLTAREPTVGRRLQARFALAEMVDPAGLGRLKVLVQHKGMS